ncbi:hypothetical protein [Streptomyces mirabilis]|uniref:hypothetical protein n=1 Tax=Streptomyces mirabilis TaxID=68239 RepID=UPI003667FEEE
MSNVADEFNGIGHRAPVLNDLVKTSDDRHGGDAGIGVVYGGTHGFTPAPGSCPARRSTRLPPRE